MSTAADSQYPYLVGLSRVERLGAGGLRRFLARMHTPQAVWEAPPEALREVSPALGEAIIRTRQSLNPEHLLQDAARAGCQVLVSGIHPYPPQLAEVPFAPLVLYVRGRAEVLSLPGVAVVGTRRPSVYGLRASETLVDELAEAGLCIISGMARGIDETAHRRALHKKAPTVAVMGCGADVCYPPESRALKRAIEEGGAVVSQFAPRSSPRPAFFPARNRVISGLARAVLVTEAGIRSGAMITAEYAIDQDRPLFAVAGSILTSFSDGCNRLLSEGVATLATNGHDILAGFNIPPTPSLPREPPDDDESRRILAVLESCDGFGGPDWLSMEEISQRSGIEAQAVLRTLVRLELGGSVRRAAGNVYRAHATPSRRAP